MVDCLNVLFIITLSNYLWAIYKLVVNWAVFQYVHDKNNITNSKYHHVFKKWHKDGHMGVGKLSLIQDGQIVTIGTFGLATTHVHQLLFVGTPDGCLLRAMSLTLSKQEILISIITLGWVVYSIHSTQPVNHFSEILYYTRQTENRFHLHTTRGFLRESGYLKLITFFLFF